MLQLIIIFLKIFLSNFTPFLVKKFVEKMFSTFFKIFLCYCRFLSKTKNYVGVVLGSLPLRQVIKFDKTKFENMTEEEIETFKLYDCFG